MIPELYEILVKIAFLFESLLNVEIKEAPREMYIFFSMRFYYMSKKFVYCAARLSAVLGQKICILNLISALLAFHFNHAPIFEEIAVRSKKFKSTYVIYI